MHLLKSGTTFGRLTVISRGSSNPKGEILWNCKCSCGKDRLVRGCHLRSGDTVSCGCWARDQTIKRSRTHGRTYTPEHRVWMSMRQRCLDKNTPNYHLYGGRGITICERWSVFENFLSDMGIRPTPKHTIERIKNHLGYQPDNCRWATWKEQARNRRNNIRLCFRGRICCISDCCEMLGLEPKVVYQRIRRGWDLHRAFETTEEDAPLKA